MVSIIVPIYNAGVFLPHTFSSLRNQTYRDLEIILVNDCSKDNSLALCRKFAAEDSRVVVIDKLENQGVDLARISGVKAAKGDYIIFLDADDWFDYDAIEHLLNISQTTGADMVYGLFTRVFSKKLGIKRFTPIDSRYADRLISGEEKKELFISYCGVNVIPIYCLWGCLYKRDLFDEEIIESKLAFGEDLLMSMQLYLRAKSFYMTSRSVMYYRWGGVTAKFQPKFLESSKVLYGRKMEVANELNFERAKVTATIELVNCLASHVMQVAQYFPKNREENIRQLQAEMADDIYDCFEIVKDNPYFVAGNLNTLCKQRDAEAAYKEAESMCKKPKAKMRFWIRKMSYRILKFITL